MLTPSHTSKVFLDLLKRPFYKHKIQTTMMEEKGTISLIESDDRSTGRNYLFVSSAPQRIETWNWNKTVSENNWRATYVRMYALVSICCVRIENWNTSTMADLWLVCHTELVADDVLQSASSVQMKNVTRNVREYIINNIFWSKVSKLFFFIPSAKGAISWNHWWAPDICIICPQIRQGSQRSGKGIWCIICTAAKICICTCFGDGVLASSVICSR